MFALLLGQVTSQLATSSMFNDYFGGAARSAAYPDLFWVANLAIGLLVALYVATFALAIRRVRNRVSNTK